MPLLLYYTITHSWTEHSTGVEMSRQAKTITKGKFKQSWTPYSPQSKGICKLEMAILICKRFGMDRSQVHSTQQTKWPLAAWRHYSCNHSRIFPNLSLRVNLDSEQYFDPMQRRIKTFTDNLMRLWHILPNNINYTFNAVVITKADIPLRGTNRIQLLSTISGQNTLPNCRNQFGAPKTQYDYEYDLSKTAKNIGPVSNGVF